MSQFDYQIEIYKDLSFELTREQMLLVNTLLDKFLIEKLATRNLLVK